MRHSPAVKAAAGIRKEKEAEIAVGGPQSHSIAEITLYIIFRRKKKEEEKRKEETKQRKGSKDVGGHPTLSFYGRDNPL